MTSVFRAWDALHAWLGMEIERNVREGSELLDRHQDAAAAAKYQHADMALKTRKQMDDLRAIAPLADEVLASAQACAPRSS